MRSLVSFLCLIILCLTSFAQTINFAKLGKITILNLAKGNYKEVAANQDKTMASKMGAENYEMIWQNLIETYDSLSFIDSTLITQSDSFIFTTTKVSFQKKAFKFKINFNQRGQICGFFISPLVQPHSPAAYVNTLNFQEFKINVPGKITKQDGVLSLPKSTQKIPLVIIVGGSGPTDKDGTVQNNKPYKDLAWALASKGVAVYRYDKCTNYGNKNLKEITIKDEYLIDLKAIVKRFKNHPKIDATRIVLMGHSLGGHLIPYFAKHITGFAGYIGLAANFNGLLELLPMQLNYLDSLNGFKNKATTASIINQLKYTQANLAQTNLNPDSIPFGLTQKYLYSLEQNGPKVHGVYLKFKPILFIQGKRDYQVPYQETEYWINTLPKTSTSTIYLYPDLNHLLMQGKGTPSAAEYSQPSNIPEFVILDIMEWLKQIKPLKKFSFG